MCCRACTLLQRTRTATVEPTLTALSSAPASGLEAELEVFYYCPNGIDPWRGAQTNDLCRPTESFVQPIISFIRLVCLKDLFRSAYKTVL